MAQIPWAGVTASTEVAAQTEQPTPATDPGAAGGLGNPTTLLLLVVAGAFLWWNMRRRRLFEERLREQRRQESMADAEQSARNVAHIMRGGVSPEAAAAAATEGLASAAWPPVKSQGHQDQGADAASADAPPNDVHAFMLARSEAAAQAEQAAEDAARQAAQAARDADGAEARRAAAAAAVAAETRADTVEAMGAARGDEAAESLRAGLRELETAVEEPLGAVEGDGTAICPPGHPVKGSMTARTYHLPSQGSYAAVVAEFCFASAEAAEAAGLQRSG